MFTLSHSGIHTILISILTTLISILISILTTLISILISILTSGRLMLYHHHYQPQPLWS